MEECDLIIIGGSAQGLSAAIIAKKTGIKKVKVIEPSANVAYPNLVGENSLNIRFGENVKSTDLRSNYLVVETDQNVYKTSTCIVALNSPHAVPVIPQQIKLGETVHSGGDHLINAVEGKDILVVGDNDRAVVLASKYLSHGANSVVLAAKGMNPDLLSPASHDEIARLEKSRMLTILFRSTPKEIFIGDDALPIVNFGDHRVPELQFDHVVYAPAQSLLPPNEIGISPEALSSSRVLYVRDPRLNQDLPSASVVDAIESLSGFFESFNHDSFIGLKPRKRNYRSAPEELVDEFYNATITYFEPTHSDLWVLRVKPDRGDISHKPGQYVTLGLGFWENRVDTALEHDIDSKWDKLVRRSYSISNRIFDSNGFLASETQDGELEFYIVLVPPTENNIPGLTPRLALKKPGDRIFLGSKVTGRYTLSPVTDPQSSVVFLSTGTGEAPHNSMIVELLRRGHKGKILSAVTVRQSKDLGYLDQHRKLEQQFPNYTYMPMPTREPDVPKKYIQEVIESGELEQALGASLDPDNTHVFMCGNPAMIGVPEQVDGVDVFPQPKGVCELLVARGFTISRHKEPGNIHFEKYW